MRADDLDQPRGSGSVDPLRPRSRGAPAEDRVRRRLGRERRARLDAERIAEVVTRELYDRQEELALFERIFVASNEARGVEEAMQVVINAVCEHTGWPIGHVYVRGEGEPPELLPTAIWRLADAERFAAFRQITEQTRFPPGIGLPGRVLTSRQPAWIVDVTKDPNFPRARQAVDIGVRAGFAFPVLVDEEVIAVLEFFSPTAMAPVEGLLTRMANIGAQLGLVIQRKRAEEEREELHRRMEVLLTSAGEGIYGVDADGRTTFANPAAARMLGWPADELIGKFLHDVVHGSRTAEAHAAGDCPLHEPDVGVDQSVDSDTFSRRDGTLFPVEYIAKHLPGPERRAGAVITFRDITERRRFESQLRYVADHDPLTGLFNRSRFEQELETAIAYARRYRTGGAVLILDIDSFKSVNDTFGHHAGDLVIRNLATLLRDRLRESDVLGRLGGDEFAVLLPQADAVGAQGVAGELVEAVRQNVSASGRNPIRVTTSVGVAMLEGEELTAEEMFIRADTAMYAAKERGGDGFALYTPEHATHFRSEAAPWSKRIRQALAEDRFVLHYQPILDLTCNDVSQIELLLRMDDEEGGLVPPQVFLPRAERFGLMEEIDAWVVRAAIRLLADHHAAGRELKLLVQINLSAKSIGSPELPKLIEEQLAATGVDPAALVFEITETAAIGNMDDARRFAERLTTLGCCLALDDFGSGFSSFYYLKYLPLAYLKIDGEFIRGLARSSIDQRVVRAMVDVAHGLGLRTIGEFVEDAATLELLRDYGVDYAQGYYIGRPRPVADLARDEGGQVVG